MKKILEKINNSLGTDPERKMWVSVKTQTAQIHYFYTVEDGATLLDKIIYQASLQNFHVSGDVFDGLHKRYLLCNPKFRHFSMYAEQIDVQTVFLFIDTKQDSFILDKLPCGK